MATRKRKTKKRKYRKRRNRGGRPESLANNLDELPELGSMLIPVTPQFENDVKLRVIEYINDNYMGHHVVSTTLEQHVNDNYNSIRNKLVTYNNDVKLRVIDYLIDRTIRSLGLPERQV